MAPAFCVFLHINKDISTIKCMKKKGGGKKSASVSVLKKYFQVLKVRKRGKVMIQDYLLTSRAMPTAEQSAAITHAEPEPKAGVHQDHHTRFLPDDVYASP